MAFQRPSVLPRSTGRLVLAGAIVLSAVVFPMPLTFYLWVGVAAVLFALLGALGG